MTEYIEVRELDDIQKKVYSLVESITKNRSKINTLEYELDRQIKQNNIAFIMIFFITLIISIQMAITNCAK